MINYNSNSLRNLIPTAERKQKSKDTCQTPEFRKKMSKIVSALPRHPNSLKNLQKNKFQKGNTPYNKGKKTGPLSDDHRKNISDALKGRVPSNKGKKMPEEQKQKLRDVWDYDKHITPEILKKRGDSIRKKWLDPTYRNKRMTSLLANPPNKNKKMSEEQKMLISKSKTGVSNLKIKGIPRSEDTKAKLRNATLHQIPKYKDTKPERMMQLALRLHGVEFERHKTIFGRPDIFIEPNVCLFVDGDYFHANPEMYSANQVMKKRKLAVEIWAYDNYVTHKLNSDGYQVIRIWESDIKKDVDECAVNVLQLVDQIRGKLII